ncbi:Protein of unknown function [Gryllus bimaculatus]|nr:Protein of unknown function [Gryllus bimaculatus]
MDIPKISVGRRAPHGPGAEPARPHSSAGLLAPPVTRAAPPPPAPSPSPRPHAGTRSHRRHQPPPRADSAPPPRGHRLRHLRHHSRPAAAPAAAMRALCSRRALLALWHFYEKDFVNAVKRQKWYSSSTLTVRVTSRRSGRSSGSIDQRRPGARTARLPVVSRLAAGGSMGSVPNGEKLKSGASRWRVGPERQRPLRAGAPGSAGREGAGRLAALARAVTYGPPPPPLDGAPPAAVNINKSRSQNAPAAPGACIIASGKFASDYIFRWKSTCSVVPSTSFWLRVLLLRLGTMKELGAGKEILANRFCFSAYTVG